MSDREAADRAYAAAVKRIRAARKEGSDSLDLDVPDCHALDRIPEEIAGWDGLRLLDLRDTAITNLSPLAGLTELEELYLSNTPVADLSPLAGMTGMQSLDLNGTAVADVAPLAGMTGMRRLTLSGTAVADVAPLAGMTGMAGLFLSRTKVEDLRPLAGMERLGRLSIRISSFGLRFRGTPATRLDPRLAELDMLEDDETRAQETVAYLRTLPPWPEPLPWLTKAPAPDPADVPPQTAAPLTLGERDGVLRGVVVPAGLDAGGERVARMGWQGMVDYIASLSEQRGRIRNVAPQVAVAVASLEQALGATFEAMNIVSVGMHGQRVARVTRKAGPDLSDDDREDVAALADATAAFVERFADWRDYRGLPDPSPAETAKIAASVPDIQQVVAEIEDRPEIGPEVAEALQRELAEVKADPTDPVAAKGLRASFGNLLSALGQKIRIVPGLVGREAREVGRRVADKLRDRAATAAEAGSVALLLTALDVFINKAAVLTALAARFPDQFGWVLRLLQAMGLA